MKFLLKKIKFNKSKKVFFQCIKTPYFLVIGASVVMVMFCVFPLDTFIEKSKTHTIVLKKDGFHPAKITISKGDTVLFRTDTSEPFWPASNQHPSHIEHPDFDSKRPVSKTDTWSFTFEIPGIYAFHDHIRPGFTGEITVGVFSGLWSRVWSIEDEDATFKLCLEMPKGSEKTSCWGDFVKYQVHTHGVQDAFEALGEAYNTDQDFAAECHGAVHEIGDAAYDLYIEGKSINFSSDTTVCGYGFYHGFLGRFFNDNPDITEAVAFCESFTGETPGITDSLITNCFHGMGHGMVEEEPLPEYYWGNKDRLLDPALAACGKLPGVHEQRQCFDGVFNGFGAFMHSNKYGFTFDPKQPFLLCDEYADQQLVFVSCYFEMAQSFAARVVGYDVEKIKLYIENVDEEIQDIVISVAVAAMMQSQVLREDNSDYFQRCQTFEAAHRERSCLHGVLNGFFAHGEPGNEAEKAYIFCAAPNATEEQGLMCEELLADHISS